MLIRRTPGLRSSDITDERLYLRRREFMRLAGSAAAETAMGKPCICPSRAQKHFPDDPVLPKWNAQACVGIPLMNSGGLAIGVIMTAYRRRVSNAAVLKGILESFAPRSVSELERRQQEEQLRRSEE